MGLTVREAGPGRGRDFESLPWHVRSAGSAAWTPPLPGDERRRFDPRHNPALEGTTFARWVAWRGGDAVGRIAAFAPDAPADVGYFGFFESVDAPDVATALLRAAERWLAERGRARVYGPIAINPRDEIGLLVEGFERPATLLTPWNPPHHVRLLEGAGYGQAITLRSYMWTRDAVDHRGVLELAERSAARSGVRLRTIDVRALPRETRLVADLVNRSFGHVWGFVPISPGEADHLAHQLRPILDPSTVLIAEDEERGPCGVALSLPDPNWLVRRIGGRLWPLGWLQALRLRRRIPWLRLMAVAVLPDRRASGTVAQLIRALHLAWLRGGYEYCEMGQVFDDNVAMRRVMDRIRFPVVRRFAVYSRDLGGGSP